MRRPFFKLLHAAMAKDPRIVFLTGDLGFSLIEPIRDDFPDRFFNMQAAEFAMVGAAIGMTYSGKIPIVYSITPFTILRPFELLRTYVNHERIPVKLIGAGRGRDYASEGISHWADDIPTILGTLPSITQWYPPSEAVLAQCFEANILSDGPVFISLSK